MRVTVVGGGFSGPDIAREVAAGPAATVIALPEPEAARAMQHALMTRFRVYTNPDVVGCEIGGAVKGAHSPQEAVEALMGRDPPATELHGLD